MMKVLSSKHARLLIAVSNRSVNQRKLASDEGISWQAKQTGLTKSYLMMSRSGAEKRGGALGRLAGISGLTASE